MKDYSRASCTTQPPCPIKTQAIPHNIRLHPSHKGGTEKKEKKKKTCGSSQTSLMRWHKMMMTRHQLCMLIPGIGFTVRLLDSGILGIGVREMPQNIILGCKVLPDVTNHLIMLLQLLGKDRLNKNHVTEEL